MIGAMDRLGQFQRATIVDDGLSRREIWEDLGPEVWVKRTDVSDAERLRAAEVGAKVTTRFLVRYSNFLELLNPRDRLMFEGRAYDIHFVKEVRRRVMLEVTASARTDQGPVA